MQDFLTRIKIWKYCSQEIIIDDCLSGFFDCMGVCDGNAFINKEGICVDDEKEIIEPIDPIVNYCPNEAIGHCRPFDDESPWNTKIGPNPEIDPKSDIYINAITSSSSYNLTSDVDQYAIAVYIVDENTPRKNVQLVEGHFSSYDFGDDYRVGYGYEPLIENVPVPKGTIAGGGTDGQVVLWNPITGEYWEFYRWQGLDEATGNYIAGNGVRYRTKTNEYGDRYFGRCNGGPGGEPASVEDSIPGFGCRGAGTTYLAGTVRPWEIEQGRIDHALAFAYRYPCCGSKSSFPSDEQYWRYPAAKSDGLSDDTNNPPEGTRLQLDPTLTDADFDAMGLNENAKVIARALQEYGMYIIDNSGRPKIFLEARETAGWDSSYNPYILNNIPFEKFRVVLPPKDPTKIDEPIGEEYTTILKPTDDSYVFSSFPNNIRGSEEELYIELDRKISYLKFNLKDISPEEISKATLKLHILDLRNVKTSFLSLTNTNWNEKDMVYATRPEILRRIRTFDITRNDEILNLDVSSVVKEFAGQEISFAIERGDKYQLWFASKENPNENLHPVLEIVFNRKELSKDFIWISEEEIMSLPTFGLAWNNILRDASRDTSNMNLSDQEENRDVYTFAKALVYARTKEVRYRNEVISSIRDAMGTEIGGRTLAIGTNVLPIVLAADLIDLKNIDSKFDAEFRQWLIDLRSRKNSEGRTLIQVHEVRPNNWGTLAGASRIAIALYLDDKEDLQKAYRVFRGWLGDRISYSNFTWSMGTEWNCNDNEPRPINPATNCIRYGYDLSNIVPDDQRRQADDDRSFEAPPFKQENYIWSALQGSVVQAELLSRAGYTHIWDVENQALKRVFDWLHDASNFEVNEPYTARGDDEWLPWIINKAYGTNYPATTPARHGKNLGYTDWTHN